LDYIRLYPDFIRSEPNPNLI